MPQNANFSPFYILRHGVTDYNLRRIVMGRLDIPLNEKGRQQARDTAGLIRALGVKRLISSPLSRARETTEIIARALGVEYATHDGLRERDWGSLTGHSYNELIHCRGVPEGAETPEIFAERVLEALQEIGPDQQTLLVAHSGVCRLLRRHFNIPDDRRAIPNAVPIYFFFDEKNAVWRSETVERPFSPSSADPRGKAAR